MLKMNMESKCPEFGTKVKLNAIINYLNPCCKALTPLQCKGVHLKLVGSFETTKDLIEQSSKKLSPTEMLKLQSNTWPN